VAAGGVTPALVRITEAATGRTATLATTRARALLIADHLVGRHWPRFLVEIDPPPEEPES
jgi:hypothetical protein